MMNASMSAPWKMQQRPGHRPSLHLTSTSTAGLLRGHGRSTLSFAPRRVSSMTRPRLVPVSMTARIMYHPATFLLHLGGITLGTMLVPAIATRRQLASNAANDPHTAASSTTAATAGPPKSLVDDRIHPSPTPRQLINLANSLRRQFHAPSANPTPSKLQSPADPDSAVPLPYDACFTLRQLHMTMQRPYITLPPTHIYGYSMPLPTLKPEKWVWRLPATCALHAMLRHLLHRPRNNEKLREMLEPLIVQLVQHALYWDGLIWAAVVKSRGSEEKIEWWWLFEKLRGNITGEGVNEDVGILSTISSGQVIETTTPHSLQRSTEMPLAAPSDAATRLCKRRSPAHRRRVERRRVEMSMNPQNMRQSQLDQADLHSVEVLGQFCEPASAAAADLTSHPLSSIPLPTLELVFDCLTRSPSSSTRSSALSIALSMSNLSLRRSARFHSQAFDLALALGRPDHAARFWSDWLAQSPYHSSGSTRRRLANELTRLKPHLRASREEFSSELGQKQLSAMATLTRALHLEWSRRSAVSEPERPLVESLLLDLVGSFPPSIEQIAVKGQSEYRRVHRLHSAVFLMARQVMLEVLSSLLGRQVIPGASVTDPTELGPPLLPSSSESSPPHRLDIFTFNVLITYALRQLQSYPIATELVSKLRQLDLTPTATTHNLLFESLLHSDMDPFEAIKSGQIPHNDHTWSLLLSHLARTKQAHRIDEVVFYLLPELNHSSVVGNSKPVTEPTPPREDKGAEFYTVLLSALVKLRKTGLAERVFRHARWASQHSRQIRPVVVETQVETEPIVRSVRRRVRKTIESTPAIKPSPDRVKSWVLPPAAYISMLLLYANEAQNPHHSLEPDHVPHQGTFVKGWGRRPLRIHTQKTWQQELEGKFGSSFASSRPRQTRSIDVSGYTRREAAAIVAIYELEISSSEEEMKSLVKAMKSDLGRKCLKILFPEMQSSEQGVGGVIRKRRRDLKEEVEVLRAR